MFYSKNTSLALFAFWFNIFHHLLYRSHIGFEKEITQMVTTGTEKNQPVELPQSSQVEKQIRQESPHAGTGEHKMKKHVLLACLSSRRFSRCTAGSWMPLLKKAKTLLVKCWWAFQP